MANQTDHARGNPGEDSEIPDALQYLTKGGSAEERARDPFEEPDIRWEPGEDNGGD